MIVTGAYIDIHGYLKLHLYHMTIYNNGASMVSDLLPSIFQVRH